jgi:two-component system cell cycle response regulator
LELSFTEEQNAKILIVDDRPENLFSLETILKQPALNIIKANSGEDALRKVMKNEFALILLDVQMPGMDGFETAELIRSNQDTQYIPIIFVTAINKDEKHVFKGYDSGAVDYIFKPLDPVILKSKVSVFLQLYHHKKQISVQNAELHVANQTILNQQSELIEEERLKVILQMAGAAAHELSQPLMVLLGNIELLEMDSPRSESEMMRLSKIKESGQKLSQIVQKIQMIDKHELIDHDSKTQILNLDRKIKMLSIEDDDYFFDVIKGYLEQENNIILSRENNLQSALLRFNNEKFDVVLMDYSLPDGTGLELLEMWQNKETCPVIFLTGLGDEILAAKILKAGAYDYITKNELTRDRLLTSIKETIDKFKLKQNVNTVFKKMAALSTKDDLTDLYNRRYMNEVLEREFNRAVRYHSMLSCLLLDLDFFKQVNDTYGHDCGDAVLKGFAEILKLNKRESDYAFRYGGEEFLLLLPETDIQGANKVAEGIAALCRKKKYKCDDNEFSVTVSIGIASIDSCQAKTATDIITFADKALYRSKADGRDCIRVFNKEETQIVPDDIIYGQKGIDYLKEHVASILEKTKQASIESLELLVKDTGGEKLENENNQTKKFISLICAKLNLPSPIVQSIQHAASLSNCFKLLLGEELLLKQGKLNQKDKLLIERLPYMQLEFLNLFEFFSNEKSVLLYNHEWFDGQGYPEGLQSEEIPIGARILSITNAVTAMISDRPYRGKLDHEAVVKELVNHSGSQFDPMLVKLFLDIISENQVLNVSRDYIAHAKKQLADAEGKITK